MKKINNVGIVGAGTMGSALAQKFAQEGFNVFLADREMQFVEKGIEGIKRTLQEGIERKLFTSSQVEKFLDLIKGTSDLNDLSICDLVIEAVFEDFNVKQNLFRQLSNIVTEDTILATNTSSFSVTELSEAVSKPGRFIGMHYFYHAAKNRLVEIIPSDKTSDETFKAMKIFSVKSGKDPIVTKDKYGFAVNRFFVPWLNEAVRLYEEGIADANRIDIVCMKLFGIGMGPFALMNATGVKIAYHAQKTLELFGNFYKPSNLLKHQAESCKNWNIEINEKINSDPSDELIKERMLGVVFFVCLQILEEKICSAAELNRGAKIGLQWKYGPIDFMQKYGTQTVNHLASLIAERYEMKLPAVFTSDNSKIEYVQIETSGNRAVITMTRPEDMNALNEDVMKQLADRFEKANIDKNIQTIFITGTGKAFVAGADIKFFIQNITSNNIPKIESFTKFGQKVFDHIDNSPKNVVAILNGLALGGGLELALCADIILALPNASLAFPETGIGIYPGLGGTQRAAKKIGKELAKYLIYTGKMLNASEAVEIGLVDGVITVDEMFELFEGKKVLPAPKKSNPTENSNWKNIINFFESNTVQNILDEKSVNGNLPAEEADKLVKTIKRKAPIALKIAEKLIDEARGCESELKELKNIFSTSDALLGLSSIGKKVEFKGE